ncbi:MAG: hypothetical protein ACD_9C00140G0003, partial [uncultured bacterium]
MMLAESLHHLYHSLFLHFSLDVSQGFIIEFSKLFELINFFANLNFIESFASLFSFAFFIVSESRSASTNKHTALLNFARKSSHQTFSCFFVLFSYFYHKVPPFSRFNFLTSSLSYYTDNFKYVNLCVF